MASLEGCFDGMMQDGVGWSRDLEQNQNLDPKEKDCFQSIFINKNYN